MIKLPKSDFRIVYPLINTVPFNKLFAEMVIYKLAEGNVYVDHLSNPSVCLVVHKYGMALLCGNRKRNYDIDDLILFLSSCEIKWLLVYPDNWQTSLPFPMIERVNFIFQSKRKIDLQLPKGYIIQAINCNLFDQIKGSVVPKSFWDKKIFLKKGIGYVLLYKNEIVSSCFTSFIIDNKYEFGIETTNRYRNKGYAIFPASYLISDCLTNGYEPVWACRKNNIGSFKLAQKLGFTPISYHPYFLLIN